MKAKNQQPYTSEIDAKEKLIVYVYEYLIHSGAKQAADIFKETIGYTKDIKVNEGSGFLLDWWCVFWDLYCATPDRRHLQPEPSTEAKAFIDFMRPAQMSPSIAQTSPTQHPQQPHPPQYMVPRYALPPNQMRGPIPRMQSPMPPHMGPHQGAPPMNSFMPANSPRYVQHPGPPPPPQTHMNQTMMFSSGPDQMGPSPGLNRMTPVNGSPHSMVGPPSNGPTPQIMVAAGHQMGAGQGSPNLVNHMQSNVPQRDGSQSHANVNYSVNSPANQPCYSGSGDPSTPHSEEYVMSVPFGQDTNDQCESVEIMKLKQSMQEDSSKLFEKEQSDFSLSDYTDSQGKWS